MINVGVYKKPKVGSILRFNESVHVFTLEEHRSRYEKIFLSRTIKKGEIATILELAQNDTVVTFLCDNTIYVYTKQVFGSDRKGFYLPFTIVS